MGALPPTGNPVFDYRAEQRARAGRWQGLLLMIGIPLGLAAGVAFALTGRAGFAYAALAGMLLACGGLGWALYWRRSLRTAFRREFGPDNEQN